jgi:homoserine dehydrogenase
LSTVRLAFLGFGNVGRALAELFIRKELELRERYQITCQVTGVATHRHGIAINPEGLSFNMLLNAGDFNSHSKIMVRDSYEFIRECGADVLFENTPVNYETGEPAVSHLKASLDNGMHAITANKGPVVHAYAELSTLAKQHGREFFFESTVMDGAPIFSLFREALPGAILKSFTGVLNSTTNMILTLMEAGESFDQAVAYCQEIGIAETDPSGDIDGWDASVKVAVLATVLMGISLKPNQVNRQGIRQIDHQAIEKARQDGKRWKLVCTARREGDAITARVAPETVTADSPLYGANGTTSIIQFETDVLGLLSVVEADPGPHTTAYGLFADFLNAVKSA